MNRITGLGMDGPVSEETLIAIENTFLSLGLNTEINLCPHADPSTLQLLTSRGYAVVDFINNYVKILSDEDLNDVKSDGIQISRIQAGEETQQFPNWSVAGYKDSGRSEFLLHTLGRIAVQREDTTLYIATIDGKVAGSGAMAILETSKGNVAYVYLDSTIPEFRGRGVQGALLRARLKDARVRGVGLAAVQARPRNGSSRNIERVGFGVGYTRVWCVKGSG